MRKIIQSVSLKDINVEDLSFIVTEGRDNTALKDAIAASGLLQPPCLWRPQQEKPYVIICGYLRLQAVASLGWQGLNVWVFSPEISQANLLEASLQDNLAHRIFNPVETAHALQRLLTFFPRDKVVSEWLPRFGQPASARRLEQFLCLCSLEQEARGALITGNLTEASARRLCSYSSEDRKAVFSLMQQLHLSAGKQSELLESLEDLSRRDRITLGDLAASSDITAMCSDKHLNRVQKTDQVRRLLRNRRNRRLCAAEERFATALKQLQVPAGIRIVPPPHFEGRTYKAEIAFASADELRQRCSSLVDQHQGFERLCAESDNKSDTSE